MSLHPLYVRARQRTAEKIWDLASALYYYWPSDLDDDPANRPWWEATVAFQATNAESDATFDRMVSAVCPSDHHALAPCDFRVGGMRMIPASEVNGDEQAEHCSCGGYWKGAIDGPYAICSECGKTREDPPYA